MVIPLGSFISRLWTGGFVSRRPCSFLDCARRGGARGVLGVLTIYTNHPGGNLMQKHDIWRNGRMTRYQVYSNQLNRLKRAEYSIALNHSPRFLKLVLNEMTWTIDFQPNFRFSHDTLRLLFFGPCEKALEPEATIAKKKSRKELKSDMKPYQCILQIWTSCHSAWLPYQPQPHFFAASAKEVETIVGVN